MLNIQKATVNDAQELTNLTRKSKAYWGYSQRQLEIWKEALQVSNTYIVENGTYLLKDNSQTIGYYSFKTIDQDQVKLDNIFLDPSHIGMGLGKVLMTDFLERVSNLGFKSVVLDSEPQAEGFYHKFGFVTTGRLESSIPGRFLPIMELRLLNRD